MENYIVSARKYRPMNFDEVVGQKHITDTLENEIRLDKLAQAFLFTGPRGVGKTTCARILAKVINSSGKDDPNKDYSFNIFELDAASNNSVDDIRALIEQVRIPPQTGRYKVYIIDEVHMLSQAAFNAFLKTLEEPPKYAIFILATTEKHKILPTILSRCQVFNFKRISLFDIVNQLIKVADNEQVKYEPEALHLIAEKADGGMRDALSLFDMMSSFCIGNITYKEAAENLNILDKDFFFKLTDYFFNGDISSTLLLLNEILDKGFDTQSILSGLAAHFRNLLVAKEPSTLKLMELSEKHIKMYEEQAKKISAGFLLNGLNICYNFETNIKSSYNPAFYTELAFLKLCHLQSMIEVGATLDEIKKKVMR
ncbi:MAG: DNA polymerase III subunit gamma/tau [Bacteroidia bacterium]|nr:DNA polymerase III subunit gamma/tau [Bacteroidia bacterium]MCO5253115.1 DNA polymerase III subunit gamma/tau [Bacteroidota bacterium]